MSIASTIPALSLLLRLAPVIPVAMISTAIAAVVILILTVALIDTTAVSRLLYLSAFVTRILEPSLRLWCDFFRLFKPLPNNLSVKQACLRVQTNLIDDWLKRKKGNAFSVACATTVLFTVVAEPARSLGPSRGTGSERTFRCT